MEEPRIDNEFERFYRNLSFLWQDYNFRLKYLTRDYGMYNRGFIIGLENNICKLVFEKETNSQVEPIRRYVGIKSASFIPPNHSYFAEYGWYPLTGLVSLLSVVKYEYHKDVDKDLDNLNSYLRLYFDKVLDLFQSPADFDKKLEYYRNLNKENQITVEKIRAERARLHALGQDSSLEAAIANLRGDKKMNNPGIDVANWERLKEKWSELDANGHKVEVEFKLIVTGENEDKTIAIDVIQKIDDEILTETVQRIAGEAYDKLGIAGLSMERLLEVYNEKLHNLLRRVNKPFAYLHVIMTPKSSTSGEIKAYWEDRKENQERSIQVNYQHYYLLKALRDKMIEKVGDGWAQVEAIYSQGALEFYFEY